MSGRADADPAVASGVPALADARWFPADIHVPRREYGFLPIGREVLERTTFLHTLIDAPPLPGVATVPVDVTAQAAMPAAAPLAWLFHTSFCCSTLLARALHAPPHQVSLNEPLVLRRLSDARHAHWPLDGLVEPTVRLLARPWDPCGGVLVKPTHAALTIAVELLVASPGSRGMILTSSLDDFLVSNLKKNAQTRAKIPALAERALQAGSFHLRLPAGALAPPDLLAAAALQWAAQRELCLDITTTIGPHRLRMLDAAAVLADVQITAWECAQWLRLPVLRNRLAQRAAEASQRNAKDIEVRYDASRRAAEEQMVRSQCGRQIGKALRWFERTLLPAMRADAIRIPAHPWQDVCSAGGSEETVHDACKNAPDPATDRHP